MNTDELWKLLDLDSVDPALHSDSMLKPAPLTSTESKFPTALKLDDWARRQGLELHECSDRLRQLGVTADAVADFHGAAFLPDPQLQTGCVDPLRYQFLQQLLETPDYQAWHASTQLCEPAAAVASVALAEQFVQLQRSSPPTFGSSAKSCGAASFYPAQLPRPHSTENSTLSGADSVLVAKPNDGIEIPY